MAVIGRTARAQVGEGTKGAETPTGPILTWTRNVSKTMLKTKTARAAAGRLIGIAAAAAASGMVLALVAAIAGH